MGQNHNNRDNIVEIVSKDCLKFIYLGLGTLVAAFLQVACWMITGERQAARIRSLYLKTILRQDIGFFDIETNTGEVIGRMFGDTILILDAMGEKVGKFIQLIATFLGGYVLAFAKGWLLTLVMLTSIPLLAIAGAAMPIIVTNAASQEQAAYAKASTIVEQTFGSIRTVASFTGEKQALSSYRELINSAYKSSVVQGFSSGLGFGVVLVVFFCSYALAIWFGGEMILTKGYTGGAVINVMVIVVASSMSLGQTIPCVTAFAAGKAAAYKMFETIERKPSIDSLNLNGKVLEDIRGEIELRDVCFSYPSRPKEEIFGGFSLLIPSGATVALVGESGSGKSTVISLIERFYDPSSGQVLIDGVDLKEFQLKWIRGKIGLVSQEPVLFSSSIEENIRYGNERATVEEIKTAAKLANAAKFIDKLPRGLETMVGEHGTQLSGGQKQRIAIARAILKDPRILLLDEATSALDAKSERTVQEALDRVMVNRTTVIVAHWLSTVPEILSFVAQMDQHIEPYSCPSPSINNCVTVKLTEKTYIVWKLQFESFLAGQNLFGFVDGTTPAPAKTMMVRGVNDVENEVPNPDYPAWIRSDQVVRSWIFGSLSEDVLSVVAHCTTGQEVWLTIAKHFNRVSSSRLFELQRKLQTVTKNDKTMAEYLSEIKKICDQLKFIGSPVTETMKVFTALNGLGQEYEPIKTTIEGAMDSFLVPVFEDVVPKLTAFDHRLQSYTQGYISPHLAFFANQSDASTNRGRGRSGYNRGRGTFTTKGRGFHQQITQAPHSGFSSSGSASGGNNKTVCQICGKSGHPAIRCWHRFNNSYQDEDMPKALAAMRITEVPDASGLEWFPDTGASAHITSSPLHLQQACSYTGSDSVMVGDGNFLPITHTGSASLASSSAWKQGLSPVPDLSGGSPESPSPADDSDSPRRSFRPSRLPTSAGNVLVAPDSVIPPDTTPLPLVQIDVVSEVSEDEDVGCTAGLDSAPIGNNTPLSSADLTSTPSPARRRPTVSNPTRVTHHPMLTRAKAGIVKPNPRYALLTQKVSYPEPKTVSSALKHSGWTAAMQDEIGNCAEAETWSLVPYTPDMHVLGSKWVFRTKLTADGELDKLRARIVAKGFNQEEGIDYLETYSPVVRTATVRTVLHTATVMNWEIKQMDVKNAFLHGELSETVYMTQPAGFEDKAHPDHVCQLHKSIYGLKQSPRAWFDKFSTYLLEFGFVCSKKDPSLFVYSKGKDIIMLLLYVDDMLITGNSSRVLEELLVELNKHFRMKDLGKLHYFLGIQAHFHEAGLFLSQAKYAEDILAVAGMSNCVPMPTPLPTQPDRVSDQEKEFENATYFKSLAGKLQYLTLTRPDLQYAVNFVCQRMHKPTQGDFKLLKRILRYVKGTLTMGISFSKNTDFTLRAYSDSDWVGCTVTRRSTGGYCTFLGNNLISWSSKKQDTVARSSTEAEYRALSEAAMEITWLCIVMKELGIPLKHTPELYGDNLSSVYLTANPTYHKRTKHFELDFHYIRERVALGAVEVGWFDEPENSSGVIGARLSADAALVRTIVGDSLSLSVKNAASAVSGLIIAFAASWRLALIILVMIPLIGINGYLQIKFIKGFTADAKAKYEEASQVASDAVGSIRTVASFCAEEKVIEMYKKRCEDTIKSGIKQGLISGLGFGFSFLILYSVYATCFYAGARLVKDGKTNFNDVFQGFLALTMTTIGISQASSFAPDSSKAKSAAASIFGIIDRKSKIDSRDESGMVLENVKGDIELCHINFTYQSRPDIHIFRDLCFTIRAGKTVALVGESGSGKSTVISLLQRFYDPDSGYITLDGVEFKKLQLKWLRQQMGLVGQEPVLFNDTIRANIAYGKGGKEATEAEIVAASELANAHMFISGIQQGYDTVVGERGIKLSGGQKQRVAIARAIMKEPKILLLDEATSALDAESERVVQEALDRVMVNRTTVVVAHRLSTIKNADVIAVVKNGVIAEKGTHETLINIEDSCDFSLMIVGSVGAMGNGLGFPLMTFLFGDLIDVIGRNLNNRDSVGVVSEVCLKFVYLGLGTLVAAFLPMAGAAMSIMFSKASSREQSAYAKASTVVEQTFGSIRTVASFTGEKQATSSYKELINSAYKSSVKQGFSTGLGFGVMFLVFFCSYALAIWFGGEMILTKGYTGGEVINVMIVVVGSSMSLGQTAPCLSAFAAGQSAAYKIFETIKRKPIIDAFDLSGKVLEDIRGEIELRDVCFSYPSRPKEEIFGGFSLLIPSGATVALVGESGSGKSTVISLIERFYDPSSGQVLIDDVDLKEFQLKWIRGKIGLVSQEPVLFSSSIMENIGYGKESATEEEIKAAAKLANAVKFIDKLPQGLETMVGQHGTQLSGGQKQRIAIARAILKNPRILLLDEATSALDAESEKVVQEALDKVMVNRTTVIVAHRLTTVRNADMIAVIHRGKIVEEGSHSELLKDHEGAYSQLIRLQEINKEPKQSENSNGSRDGSISVGSSRGNSRRHDDSVSDIGLLTAQENTQLPQEQSQNVSITRIAALNKPETPILVLGTLVGAVNGTIFPIFGFLFSKVIVAFYKPPHELRNDSRFWSMIFVFLGVASLILFPINMYLFAVAGGRLVQRIRSMCFEKVVHMEIEWFDKPENSSGALGARLSVDAALIRTMVGDSLSLSVKNTASAVTGMIIAFSASWEVAVIILVMIPLTGINGYVQLKLLKRFSADAKTKYEEASQVANDAVGSIRTVASFCAEEKVIEMYKKRCEDPIKSGIKQGLITGLGFGFSFFVLYSVYATCFYAGSRLVKAGKTNYNDVFQVFLALAMTTIGISGASSFAPDSTKAKSAAASIFGIIDRKSKIDSSDDLGMVLENVKGDIELCHINFTYQTRPDIHIFRDLCLTIRAGKTVALVGESGSGKSTVISLLQRFYDPNSGYITLDGVEFKKLQLKWLRQQMGLVGQEPVLFNDTIRANIAYGKDGKEATEAEIVAASELANAHGFISSIQQGYDTVVGERGIQLSGGQKQRVAIARAIVKEPKILLLDEATSALDAESERVVQEALDRVMVNRTTVVVAHRLSTIKNADVIAVVKNGVIAEKGTHETLISIQGGVYASLGQLHMSASN
ncbi:hypothetical protein AALP_AA6G020200 [Arabis alpina]|uniref:Uncharacterized protein n=1 Tax=Arabis alpina TaxID=50452 RepID=A0A087GLI1_ARAAL|nr:hypothetical protein AALP_AA6G020200 [Arabis alpina]